MPLKIYFFCTLLYLFPAVVFAQNKVGDQDVAIGYGYLTSEQILDGNHIFAGMKEYSDNAASGLFSIQYKYFVSNAITIGLVAGYEQESGNWFYDDMMGKSENWSSFQIGVFSRHAFTIVPEVSIAYCNEDVFRIYTTVAFGYTFKQETDVYQQQFYGGNSNYTPSPPGTKVHDNPTKFAGYYSPFGIRFGGNVGGFLELGIGYKGVLNGGVSYILKSPKINKVNRLPGASMQ